MSEKPHCCLMTKSEKEVPLKGVRIQARIQGLCSEVTVTQRYENLEKTDVEAVYVFPLEEAAAVCAFSAKASGRTLVGRVEERDKAFEAYDDAMADGHGAFLMDQERPNVFTVSVGNLRPKEEIEIAITYVALLHFEDQAIRLTIPTTVSPRYVPARLPEVGQPDSERVNPDRQESVPYGLSLAVEIASGSPLSMVESPSHPVRVALRPDGATVTLSAEEAALDRDFVLLVTPSDAHRPEARVAREEDGTRVAMVTFHPDDATLPAVAGHEVLFLVDCSGSMQGDSIEQARKALALCIRALCEGDTFNVTCFGSHHSSLWKAPVAYDGKSLEEASRHLRKVDASLGGTEILAPLKELLDLPRDPGRTRDVLLLTDGQVGNEDEVIALCGKHADHARLFTFGIGAGASEHLVRGAARASRGAAELIYPGERIEPKVLRMFRRVTSPVLGKVTLDWGGVEVDQSPASCPPVFRGDALTVFARIRSGHTTTVTLRADDRSFQVPIDLERPDAGGPIPTLWARESIRDLEAHAGAPRGSSQRERAEQTRRARLIEISTRYGLLSAETSYVAIEERAEADRSKGPAELRKVPVAITVGWHGRGSVLALKRAMPAGGVVPGIAVFAAMPARFAPAPPSPARGRAVASLAPPPADPRPAQKRTLPGRILSGKGVAEAAKDKADRLFDVLVTQEADGSFVESKALEAWLGVRWKAVKAHASQHDPARVFTSVVIALCEREAADRSDEWRPAVEKARRWLEKHGGMLDVTMVLSAERS